MRTYFEENGWLPAPIPGKSLRNLRRKAVQYLGLAGGIDSHGGTESPRERFSIIQAFGRVVKEMFTIERVLAIILRGESLTPSKINRGIASNNRETRKPDAGPRRRVSQHTSEAAVAGSTHRVVSKKGPRELRDARA